MNPFNLIGQLIGETLGLATGAVKTATALPRLLLHLLQGDSQNGAGPIAAEPRGPVDRPTPGGPAPGGTGRRAPASPSARRPRATVSGDSVEVAKSPPEPTSAAGASGGVAGTVDAPGDAAAVSAPDPTAASSTRRQPTAPAGERRMRDTSPAPSARRATAPEPKRSEIDRRREEQREAEAEHPAGLVESEGAADPGATIHVDAPWDGYASMKAGDVVARLQTATDAEKAIVRLYESTHKKRKSILDATS